MRWKKDGLVGLALATLLLAACAPPAADVSGAGQGGAEVEPPVLASWNDGPTRQAIVDFVSRVTDPASPEFVPEQERIATFDNDGTLWSEQPIYFQILFAIDRVREMAPEHPEWSERQPFKGAIEGDFQAMAEAGEQGLMELVGATHAGMTVAEFEAIVESWVETARHPQRDRPYIELVYQPMLELLEYLRSNGFQTWITSGGGMGFMRPWVEEVYGIPPEQVIGTAVELEYQVVDGVPSILRLPELHHFDDKEGKPVGIRRFIGRRPIAAFGNSDGDFQMLEWATSGEGARLGVLIHHTDAEREWAYDRESAIGRLVRGLDEADERGWLIVDMARDWATVYPSP